MFMGLKSEDNMYKIKEVGYCYADDVKNYWKASQYEGEYFKYYDPDIKYGIPLQDDLETLYKREPLLNLVKGNDLYDYLCLDGTDIRFGCDSIGNAWFYEESLTKEEQKKYLQMMNTIGGKIIFPKHIISINSARGFDGKIKDRFDLTLECIRLYYEKTKEKYPLKETLEKNHKFFHLFKSFKEYVDFFFLNCLIDKNENIKFFIDEKFENPVPDGKRQGLYLKTMEFVENRNKEIKEFLDKENAKK